MTGYGDWRVRHPQAAAELEEMLQSVPAGGDADSYGKSENWAQQQARFEIGRQGALSWRNNVGARKTTEQRQCPGCGLNYQEKVPPLRWGLANDSHQLNKRIKSSDLILGIPRLVTPAMVGTVLLQFGAVETKRPGWVFNPNDQHQAAQAAWLQLIRSRGGFGCFSTGGVDLSADGPLY